MEPINKNAQSGASNCPFYENAQVRRIAAVTVALMAAASGALLYFWKGSSTRAIKVLRSSLGVCSLTSLTLFNLSIAKKGAPKPVDAYQLALKAPSLATFIRQNNALARSINVTPELRAKMEREIPDFETLKKISHDFEGGFWSKGWISDTFVLQKGTEYVLKYTDLFLKIEDGNIPVKIASEMVPEGTTQLIQQAKQKITTLNFQIEGKIQTIYNEQQREEKRKQGVEGANESIAQDIQEFKRKRDELLAERTLAIESIKAAFIADLNKLKSETIH